MTENKVYSPGLVYPIYLDAQMMASFVAALTGGYALENNVTRTQEYTKESSKEGTGEVGISDLFANFVKADVKGSVSSDNKQSVSEQSQVNLKHTESSLFMGLRDTLYRQGIWITRLDELDEAGWSQIRPSQIVEVSGYVYRSPANEILQLIERVMPLYLHGTFPFNQDGSVDLGRLTDEQRTGLQFYYALQKVSGDLESQPLSDMLLQHKEGRNVVLDISTKILPLKQQESLLCGQVVVLGKATRVLAPTETINLHRRVLTGYIDPEQIAQALNTLMQQKGLNLQMPPSIIKYPAIEIIPMAIFV